MGMGMGMGLGPSDDSWPGHIFLASVKRVNGSVSEAEKLTA